MSILETKSQPHAQPSVQSHALPQVAEGLLQQVDLVNRTVTVLRGADLPTADALAFDVPPTCEILLNGERVKLRMLQPRDRVRLTFYHRPAGLMALSLEACTRRETECHQHTEEQP
jgi:hypothetical protein